MGPQLFLGLVPGPLCSRPPSLRSLWVFAPALVRHVSLLAAHRLGRLLLLLGSGRCWVTKSRGILPLGLCEFPGLVRGDESTASRAELSFCRGSRSWRGRRRRRSLCGLCLLGVRADREGVLGAGILSRLGGRDLLALQGRLGLRVVVNCLLPLGLHGGRAVHHLERLLLDMLRPVTLSQRTLIDDVGGADEAVAHHPLNLREGVSLALELVMAVLVGVVVHEGVADDAEGEGAPVTVLLLLLLRRDGAVEFGGG